MTRIDQSAPVHVAKATAEGAGSGRTGSVPSEDFASLVEKGIDKLDSEMEKADRLSAALAAGKEMDISEVMIAISKADISFRMFLQLRNKALSAYEEIMRLQF